ncbi:putative Methyl-accepting chemotaxis protein [Vibrio nigripulchritudo MADA3029]|uniref:methyl-accepting chemotaxis protein n=1 Tax=Vibrio nigripulchritudo TaxID=28173 RepID=UPI0003B21A12|nr:methyl-accepting chemotaxis protein [Vibrio nigripulchritudo]CCN46087.1 putative Methyl-accepting chemotaxis protein [Vibrio nigripulchritudo MADA3020]CCN51703.1 putative Methyl-accepting chemotaxis protein [Vibrio nigripulchritudo MADA3021]CCN61867.1 putative Methyl-accepting chemotaxis protein [Vibrio nigripulchritudo MADA3029]
MSVKSKLVTAIGFLIAFTILVTSVIGYFEFKTATTDDYRKNLSDKSFLVAKAVEGKMDKYFTALETVAAGMTVDASGELVIDEALINTLKQGKSSLKVLNMYVGLPDGTTYDTNGLIADFNAKQKQREWYIKGFSGAQRTVTNPYMATTGHLTMSVVIPFRQRGDVHAVIGLSLKMSDITDYINQLSAEPNLFVSRSDGFLMAASYPEFVGKNLFELRPSYRQYGSHDKSEHSYNVPDKGDFYVVSSRIESLGWSVWAWANWDDINEPSNTMVSINSIAGLIFAVIGIVVVYFAVDKLMYGPIGGEPKEIEEFVDRIAKGDLTKVRPLQGNETGVYRSTLIMGESIKQIISNIDASSAALTDLSGQLESSSNQVNRSSESQMMQLEQVATAMNEMTATVAEVAQNAMQASTSSNDASESSSNGLSVVSEMNDDINLLVSNIQSVQSSILEVEKETLNVGGILDVIRGIAEQTNLLALNAAIEAARAGEQGRGFAVVADEVRNLANKTQESTNEIQSMIAVLQEQAKQSVSMMEENAENAKKTLVKSNEASQSLQVIQDEIGKIQDMNNQIATAAEEQSHVATDINENVVNVNDLARNTVQDVQSNVQTAMELNSVSSELQASVNRFKV